MKRIQMPNMAELKLEKLLNNGRFGVSFILTFFFFEIKYVSNTFSALTATYIQFGFRCCLNVVSHLLSLLDNLLVLFIKR